MNNLVKNFNFDTEDLKTGVGNLEGVRVVKEKNLLTKFDEMEIGSFWARHGKIIGNSLSKCALEDVNGMFVDSELNRTVSDRLSKLIREIPFEENPGGLEGDGVSGYKVKDGRIACNKNSLDRDFSRCLSFERSKTVDGSGESGKDANLDSEFTLKSRDQLLLGSDKARPGMGKFTDTLVMPFEMPQWIDSHQEGELKKISKLLEDSPL